uniref:Uncharacterized protein n=1 Tax=Moniliophthora roreri TaxID=221103 RepID=A0A0W0EVY0_MONRR
MPLPLTPTGKVALHPKQPNSRPKHAIILRLNSESLNALDSSPSQPEVDIDFTSSNPGLWVNNQFYPLRFQKEEVSHEIYLRAAPGSKSTQSVPLKAYASVMGKVNLAERELDSELADRIRQKREVEEEKRNQSKAIFLDEPPPQVKQRDSHGHTKEKKKPAAGTTTNSMFRKPVKASDQPHRAPKASALTTASVPKDPLLKKKVIHCLAQGEKSLDDLARAIGGDESLDIVTRREVSDLLEETPMAPIEFGLSSPLHGPQYDLLNGQG